MQLILLDRYELIHGIRNHEDEDSPLGVVLMNDAEDWVTGGATDERMDQYLDANIKEAFGLSFREFIDQPTWLVHLQLKKAAKKQAVRQKEIDAQLQGLKAADKG